MTRKEKFPTDMQSKNWPKCPICLAPYKHYCTSCGYKRIGWELSQGRDVIFKRANEK